MDVQRKLIAMMAAISSFRVRVYGSWCGFLNLWLLFPLLLAFPGCGSEPAAQISDSDDTALMDDLLNGVSGNADNRSVPVQAVSSGSQAELDRRTAVPQVARAAGERLELRLQPGDRFPLIKTVEQVLTQRSQQFPATATTRLELTMAITVEEVRADAILFRVRYSEVAYSHDLNGNRLNYDSSSHQHAVPVDVQPYAGMVNNGFGFWVGRDNRIRELVGYQEFLERCVHQVAVERRQTLLAEISDRFGDDGVANFIDDSIGLLPFDASVDPESATRVAPGDVWTREVRMMQPAPVYMTSTYRLVDLNSKTAEIDITGRIASGETVSNAQTASLKIIGGHGIGKCIVDRATGLPLEMNQTRMLSMVVTLPDGTQIPQEKQITTTVRAFPEMRGSTVQQTFGVPSDSTPVVPAAAFDSAPNAGTPIPTQTGGGAVRAAYPPGS